MMPAVDMLLSDCSAPRSSRRTYDHRLREAICETRDPSLFDSCVAIPRSTARSWLRRGRPQVVSLDEGDFEVAELRLQIAKLERRVQRYSGAARKVAAVVRLMRGQLDASGYSFENQRVPAAVAKTQILSAVARVRHVLPLVIVLKLLRLSSARYHAWLRAEKGCSLEDRSSCPKTSPTQLTADELLTMKEMVTSDDYRHMPLSTLALFAQRIGRVFASASTWSLKVRERGWSRLRKRVYPAKPRVGIRANKPNEIWHVDASVIRLLDGAKVYLHAVVDNFSRKILAWRLCERLDPLTTVAMLREAAQHIGITPMLVADSGIENVNAEVDTLIEDGVITRILALVEVTYSNSIVEAYWRSLKHQWLFLNSLNNLKALERLVAFHVEQHNSVMPHSAFRGQTPNEVYFGTGAAVPGELAAERARARRQRLSTNHAVSCPTCEPESRVNSPSMQLRCADS